MKKKMIIFATVLAALVAVLVFVVNYQNTQQAEGNPYGKDNLDQATIDQLDDPLYDNQILPDELDERIQSGEPTTVYFYSPTCIHCQRTTPVVVPMTEELGIDMVKLNLLEFPSTGNQYQIQSTPTIVHYENGEEVERIVGERPEGEFEAFFNEHAAEDAPEQTEE
ncbi:thioredoxin [Halobacillus fulvus]|nr:thioredoxin [Halobacillus fulvus]